MTTLPNNATSFDFTRFNFAHDFILNDKPYKFCRERDSSPQLAKGATLLLPYGKGYVEARTGDHTYLVRIVEVDDSWTQVRTSGEITAREYIQERNDRYNGNLLHESSWLANYLKEPKRADRLLNLLVDPDVIEVRYHSGIEASEFAYELAVAPKAKKTAVQQFSRWAYRSEKLEEDDFDLDSVDLTTRQEIQEELGLDWGSEDNAEEGGEE